MVTRLKSSIKYEVLLVVAWIIWSVMVTLTTNFFAGMEILVYIKAYLFARACVIIGGIGSVILGAVLLWSTIRYLASAWEAKRPKPIFLDRIPCEIVLVIAAIFGSLGIDNTFEAANDIWWTYRDFGRVYYLVSGFLRCLSKELITLSILWLALWILMRQFCYRYFLDTSLIWKFYMRYHKSSGLGKKITRNRWILVALLIVSTASAVLGILFGIDYDEDMALFFGLVFGLCQLGIVLYLRFSGMMAADITSLVEQVRSVSQAEPLDKVFQVSETSLFYEPFHQLEELDEAVKRSAKKQLEAERLKVDLITNVSHDLKTPLTSMVGYTDLLKQEDLGPEARDYVDIISVKQEQLKEMIQQLFELSKATSGVEQLQLETLDMRKLMEQILGDMEDRIKNSGQTIRTHFDEPPLLFTGDNEKMYRVVQNLLENALKYSLDNTRIYIDVKRTGKRLVLQMKNIASYEMNFAADEITERFVRGDQSRTTEGHGLGLAIASSFTQNMGGMLNVDVDGDLFKVTVEFPAVTEEEES